MTRDGLAAAKLVGNEISGTLQSFSLSGLEIIELRTFGIGDRL